MDNNTATQPQMTQMVFCRACGTQMHVSAANCPKCGATQAPTSLTDKRLLPAFLLHMLLPFLGGHRFYVGKIGTGILFLLTFGGLGLWWLIDLILMLSGSFTDKDGHQVTQWT